QRQDRRYGERRAASLPVNTKTPKAKQCSDRAHNPPQSGGFSGGHRLVAGTPRRGRWSALAHNSLVHRCSTVPAVENVTPPGTLVRSSPARMQTGRPATDDLDSSIVKDTETTMVRVMVGYSDSARGMRLRLRFDDRELVVDERLSSVRMSSTGGHSANLALSG